MRIGTQIRRFIERELLAEGAAAGDPLALELLDSLAMEQLVAFIEERFGVRFVEEEVTAESFASIPTVVDLVRRKRRSSSPR